MSDANDENSEEYRVYWESEQKGRISGNNDPSTWYLAFYTEIPLDQTRVLGWFVTWLIQLFMAYSYVLCMTTNTTFFVSCCYYIYAMCEHYNVVITSAGRAVERIRIEVKPSKTRQLRHKIDARLCNVIKIQNQMYE